MREIKESSQRRKRPRRKLCPTHGRGENTRKGGEAMTFKMLSKVTEECSLKLILENAWISWAKLALRRSFVLR